VAESEYHADLIVCDASRFFPGTHGESIYKYVLGIHGGSICSHYAMELLPFVGDCESDGHRRLSESSSISDSGSTSGAEDAGHGGQLYCDRGDEYCQLSERHYMLGSCDAHERTVPFRFALAANETLNNLVFVIEDLNPSDNPSSLSVELHRGAGSHEQLQDAAASNLLMTSTSSRRRMFSIGLNAFELNSLVCGTSGCSEGSYSTLSLVVACQSTAVRYRVLAELIETSIELGVPAHGEVCPDNWIYHKVELTQPLQAGYVLRFEVDVHDGDAYYAMSRWAYPPSFAACNDNEVVMSGVAQGAVDLCGQGEGVSTAYVGIYGGSSCAVYTVEAHVVEAPCSMSLAVNGGPCPV